MAALSAPPGAWQTPPAFPPGFVPGMLPQYAVPSVTILPNPMLYGVAAPVEEGMEAGRFKMVADGRYNMNEVLTANITSSDYFKSLHEVRMFHEIVDEIYDQVDHVESFGLTKTRIPSTAFCLLYKLFTMNITAPQLRGLLAHKDSPYIRAVGFLFLRYVCDPKDLWEWFEPYLDDPEMFVPGGNREEKKSIGEYCKGLLSNINYYGTVLKRIPIPIHREIEKRMMMMEIRKAKAKENEKFRKDLEVGTNVQAEYTEAGKTLYYNAVIEEVLDNGKFQVHFPEYGNREEVDIGQIKFDSKHSRSRSGSRTREEKRNSREKDDKRDKDRDKDDKDKDNKDKDRDKDKDKERRKSRSADRRRRRSRSHSKRSRSRDRDRRDRGKDRSRDRRDRSRSREKSPAPVRNLEAEIMKKQRDAAAAVGRDYARRPASYKTALSLKVASGTRKRSKSPPQMRSAPQARKKSKSPPPIRKQPSAEALANLAKLKDIYGDASSKLKVVNVSKPKHKPAAPSVESTDVIRLGFSGT